MSKTRSILGQKGEAIIAKHLETQGYTIVERNFRTRQGEVDLIAQKKGLVAFVEVKSRKHEYFDIASVVNLTKQRKIIRAAKEYILKNNIENCILRFDVATLLIQNNNHTIDYIENAFGDQS